MSIDRNKRASFEKVADIYEERRCDYPAELIDDILEMSRIQPDGQILEIGYQPGNTTIPFAKRGYKILGIELGERLAAIATQNCQAYPEVEIKNIAFEGWELKKEGLIWH